MADGISFKFDASAFHKGIAERQKRMPRAAMWAVREAGRAAKKAGRQAAPVLRDKSTISVVGARKAVKSGARGVVADAASGPVRGLLKASITPSKHVREVGGVYSLKVGPRGERVHLYAAKIEEKAHFMDAADAAAKAELGRVAEQAFGRVWKGR